MKKISFIILLTILINLSSPLVFGDDSLESSQSEKIGYELYQERVSNFCNDYKVTDSSSELIYIINDDIYDDLDDGNIETGDDLETAKQEYRDVMDGIYDCATSVVYYKSYELIKNSLINKNSDLKSTLEPKLDQKQQKIEEFQTSLNEGSQNSCKLNYDNDNSIIKKSVLKQTTYELCRYNFYLEYLKEMNDTLSKLDANFSTNQEDDTVSYIEDSNNSYSINMISEMQNQKINDIDNEIENSYKVFPFAYQAYSDFENNITIHILLELLREAYDTFRESLHKSLNPINQVVYKISNAMKP